MKNGIIVRLFSLLLMVTFALSGCAEKTDSTEKDPVKELAEYSTAKETIGINDIQKLIAYYRMPMVSLFGYNDSIEEILKSEYVYNIYYLVEQNGKIVELYACEEGEISRISGYLPAAKTDPWLLNSIFSEELPDNAEVLDVYHLDGEANHNGHALYVRTTVGDFVYYDYFLTSEVLGKQQTFFTGSEFFDLMKAAHKYELESWDYTDEPQWLPIVIGAGVAVVAAGGAVWLLLHKKKKKAKGSEECELPNTILK